MSENRTTGITEQVLGFEEALAVVLTQACSMANARVEIVNLGVAAGRVLAAAVRADRDQPPFHRSTRDGFAVRTNELATGRWLKVEGSVRAGELWDRPLASMQAVEIMTGAPVPEGTDAVVMVEHVEEQDGRIRLADQRTLSPGENIVPRGSEAREGVEVLPAGTVLLPASIALAAACGASQLQVYKRPVVAVIATGDELVEITQTPGPVQIRNSNSYGLAALIAQARAIPHLLPIARDRREELDDAIRKARRADLLLLSGGVSMGKFDLVEASLAGFGAQFHFTGVRLQPGKPTVFGHLPELDGLPRVPFFGLPGNPVSTQVTFHCFVEPLLRAMGGATAAPPRFVQAVLGHDVAGRKALTRVLPAKLTSTVHGATVQLVTWQGSGDLAANAQANCYAVFPEDRPSFHKGDLVAVLLQ